MRRAISAIAIATGLGLVVFTFVEHLPSRSHDAERVSVQYRQLMSGPGLADLRSGFNAVAAGGTELITKAEPQLQHDLGMSDAEFTSYVSTQMPGVAAFNTTGPKVVALVDPVITRMQAERADYHSSDQIPIGALPMSSAPWLFLGIAAALIVLGIATWAATGRGPVLLLLLLSGAIAIAPLVIRIPAKIHAAERLAPVGRIGLAPKTAQAAVGAANLFDAVVADANTKLVPAFASARHLSQADAQAYVASTFPALAKFVTVWPGLTAPSHELANSQVRFAPVFANADRIPLGPVPWLFIAPGALLALLSGGWLIAGRGRPVPALEPALVAEDGPQVSEGLVRSSNP